MQAIEQYLASNRGQFEETLFEFLRIPSVSTDTAGASGMRRAAEWVAGQLSQLGLTAEVIATSGHPLVFAQSAPVPGAPTVLVYGHYDVQPVEPLELWTTPPFEPTVRDGRVYARGATDDKGQLLTHIKGAESWIRTVGKLPVQLKFLIEGEEEIGSPSLPDFIRQNRERLKSDCLVISDGSQYAPGQPSVTYGLRGIAYYELFLTGPCRDLHSGVFGGSVVNPVVALAKILAALVDERGRIQLPGFYDKVKPLTERERAQFAALGFDDEKYKQQLGVQALGGEEGYTTLERRWARPTFDVNGIWGGYQGEGAKTVLPSKAGAKFSFRLVPNQQPHDVTVALRKRLAEVCPAGVEMELVEHHGGPGVAFSLESPYMAAAAKALEIAFGTPPVYTREGGSIPIVATFHDALQVDTLLLGWGQDDDNTHSPNERFLLDDFHRGIRASAHLWNALSQIQP